MTDNTSDTTPAGYRIAAVEARTGISAAALRKWEERYAFPQPTRTEGGHRVYTEADIQGLMKVQHWIDRGMTVSSAVERLRAGDEPLGGGSAQAAADLEVALLSGDRAAADTIVADAFAMYRFDTVVRDVFAAALRSIGDGWLAGNVSVAQEHFASAYVRARLERLIGDSARLRGAKVMITTPPGERHEIGALIVACTLHRRGLVVRYLGPDTPIDAVKDYARASGATALVLSATIPGPLAALPDGAYEDAAPTVIMGGNAVLQDPTRATRLGARPVTDTDELAAALPAVAVTS